MKTTERDRLRLVRALDGMSQAELEDLLGRLDLGELCSVQGSLEKWLVEELCQRLDAMNQIGPDGEILIGRVEPKPSMRLTAGDAIRLHALGVRWS